MKAKKIVMGLGLVGLGILTFGQTAQADTTDSHAMYRLYNPNSGEHFYTQNSYEQSELIKVGWSYEGVGWYAPTQGAPVYRLYNPNASDHHYTLDINEKNMLVAKGWSDEGIGFQSADPQDSVKLFRAYNPNAKSGSHNYTAALSEQLNLVNVGWRDEGIAWYGVKVAEENQVATLTQVLGKQTIDKQKTSQLTAYFSPTGAPTPTITWTSADPTIATVSDTGLVTGVKMGKTTITAQLADGQKKSVAMTVTDEQANAIKGQLNFSGNTLTNQKVTTVRVTFTSQDPRPLQVTEIVLADGQQTVTYTQADMARLGFYTKVGPKSTWTFYYQTAKGFNPQTIQATIKVQTQDGQYVQNIVTAN